MRGCVCAGVSSRARRNAAVTSSCLLHASERGIEGKKKMTQPFSYTLPPLLLFHPFGLRFPSSEGSLFYCNEFGDSTDWKGGKGFKGGKKCKVREVPKRCISKHPYLHSGSFARVNASNLQQRPSWRPTAPGAAAGRRQNSKAHLLCDLHRRRRNKGVLHGTCERNRQWLQSAGDKRMRRRRRRKKTRRREMKRRRRRKRRAG